MTITMTEDETERWLSSPIVRHVRTTYSPADTLELLEGILLVCDELEDRFPGLPFREILSTTSAPSPWATLRTLTRNPDISPEDITTIFSRFTFRKPNEHQGHRGRFDGMTDDYFQAIHDHGHSSKELRSHGWGLTPCSDMHFAWWWSLPDEDLLNTHGGASRCRRRLDDQDRFDELVRLVVCDDVALTQAGPAIGVTASTASRICGAFLYQLWLATEGRLP